MKPSILVRPTRPALLAAALCLLPALPQAQRAAHGELEPEHTHAGCSTDVRFADVPLVRGLKRKGMYQLDSPPELVFSVPLSFHIVRRSNGTGGPTIAALDGDIPVLNAAFQTTGIRFFRTGSVDFIDSNLFFNGITTQIEADVLRNTNAVANTINVYFIKDFSVAGRSLCGQSSFSYSSPQGILMDTDCMPNTGNPSTLPHEFGHYFDLFHTHETAFGVECPDGSNCFSAGDLLCDTPADPNVRNMTTGCAYTGTAQACGSPYGNPPVSNFMSGGPSTCRNVFTPFQRLQMGATLLNLRSNLLGSQASVFWVDWGYSGFEFGSFSSPWNTLSEALVAAPSGATIVVKSGSTSETLSIDQNVFIDTFQGPATIGQ